MNLKSTLRAGTVILAIFGGAIAQMPVAKAESTGVQRPQDSLDLGVGKGTLVRLPGSMSDVFVANNKIADVQVRSAQLLYIFGTGAGETSVYATDKAGRVVYSATVRVAQNIDQIKSMLGLAMPAAKITVTPMNGMVLLTGTVSSAGEVEEASRLVQGFVGEKTVVVNKLQTALPVQVNLQVKIAEVSRDLLKQVGVNLASLDGSGGFLFGINQGRPESINFDTTNGTIAFAGATNGTSIGMADKFLGMNLAGVIDLLEDDGVISMLAEPNLTALSGETASFLAGGEFPVTVVDGEGRITVEFKEYGVGLAFTPTVLEAGRISMRVRPEVSELTNNGSVRLNNITIPALVTRRAETTVELGSGQSFMIGGLIRNRTDSTGNKAPILGDLPILGALFKSNKFQRQETELVIVITPYLVKPMQPNQVHLPTDGYQAPTDMQRWFLNQTFSGQNSNTRPAPKVLPSSPATDSRAPAAENRAAPAPGFSGN